uniref:Uncharacterized protein n=1 Tax=Cucumis sativus TaxID=3659 RepID=A0A0A0KBF3_CUCSA
MDQIKDASSFFLWEDSADSEVDKLLSHPPHQLESAVDDADDQEDACSCSCNNNDFSIDDFQDAYDGDNGDGDQDIGLIGDGGRRRSGAGYEEEEEEEEEESSNNDVGAIRNMNEMEDKVFWDTCMAGGYP